MLTPAVTSQSSRDEFLQLLISQLRNQDPLEPVEQQDFIAQLAQFSTLEGVEKLNANFAELLSLQEDKLHAEEVNRGTEMIGQRVHYDILEKDHHVIDSGVVEGVDLQAGGLALLVGGRQIPVANVFGVGELPEPRDETSGENEKDTSSTPTVDADSQSQSTGATEQL